MSREKQQQQMVIDRLLWKILNSEELLVSSTDFSDEQKQALKWKLTWETFAQYTDEFSVIRMFSDETVHFWLWEGSSFIPSVTVNKTAEDGYHVLLYRDSLRKNYWSGRHLLAHYTISSSGLFAGSVSSSSSLPITGDIELSDNETQIEIVKKFLQFLNEVEPWTEE